MLNLLFIRIEIPSSCAVPGFIGDFKSNSSSNFTSPKLTRTANDDITWKKILLQFMNHCRQWWHTDNNRKQFRCWFNVELSSITAPLNSNTIKANSVWCPETVCEETQNCCLTSWTLNTRLFLNNNILADCNFSFGVSNSPIVCPSGELIVFLARALRSLCRFLISSVSDV